MIMCLLLYTYINICPRPMKDSELVQPVPRPHRGAHRRDRPWVWPSHRRPADPRVELVDSLEKGIKNLDRLLSCSVSALLDMWLGTWGGT
jgi:hypothetical protein